MIIKPVRAGMPIREAVTSNLINTLTKTKSPTQKVEYPTDGTTNRTEVIAQLWQGQASHRIEAYQAILLYEPYYILDQNAVNLANRVPTEHTIKGDRLLDFDPAKHGWLASWGIAQEAITATRAGRVLIAGTSWLKKEGSPPSANVSTYRGIDIVNGTMTYDLFGRAEVIGTIGPSNQTHCLVNLSRRIRTSIRGKTISSIPANSSGAFYLKTPNATSWVDTTVQLIGFNPHPTQAIGENKEIVANEVDGRWVIIFEPC